MNKRQDSSFTTKASNMSKWYIEKGARPNTSNIFVKEDMQPIIFLGEVAGGVHTSLIEIKEHLKPYDIIITPEAKTWMLPQTGESNN
jgi:hypothetical protein